MNTNDHTNQDPLPPGTPIPEKSLRQKLLALICILLLLGGGFLLARSILLSKKPVQRKSPKPMKTVVQVTPLHPEDITYTVAAMGTVLAAEELILKPWLSGRIEYLHPSLSPGGLLKKGEIAVKLNQDDYTLALAKRTNTLEKARMDLRLEAGNQAVAKREYELILEYTKTGSAETPMDLALRKPQLAKVKATLAVAQTEVDQAKLNLARTSLKVPFNAVVLSKEVAIGSQVTPQTTMAVLAGSKFFHIRISLPAKDIERIMLPDQQSEQIQVKITPVNRSGQDIVYHGHILRRLRHVDPQGLMPRLLIEVENPLEQQPGYPLLLGSMVEVELPGKIIPNCFAVPAAAVRADKTVLLADNDNRLEIRPVQSCGRNNEFVYVTDGLDAGERIITSPVAAPVAGMELTLATKKHKRKISE
jgi:RND family efflux transporter MFP subunit